MQHIWQHLRFQALFSPTSRITLASAIIPNISNNRSKTASGLSGSCWSSSLRRSFPVMTTEFSDDAAIASFYRCWSCRVWLEILLLWFGFKMFPFIGIGFDLPISQYDSTQDNTQTNTFEQDAITTKQNKSQRRIALQVRSR